MDPLRFFIKTYGCTLNQSDADSMKALLLEKGAAEAESESAADVVIVNTCTVKTATEQKIALKLKSLAGKKAQVVVAGCLPAANRTLVEKIIPGACIVGPAAVSRVYEAALAAAQGKKVVFLGQESKAGLPSRFSGLIARVSACDGCLSNCHFCQTKLARPKLQSRPAEEIIGKIGKAIEAGAVEIQLTGQDLGAYGKEMKTDLEELLEKIAAYAEKNDSNFFVRVGMLNPEHALKMNRLPALMARRPFYKFVHLPLQSGSDAVLKAMNRRHSVTEYERLVGGFRAEIPGVTLATDIICGFPGETDEDFEATLEAMKRMRFDVVNVSRFTPRPGTIAFSMKQLPQKTINDRTRRASALARKISLDKNREWIGRRVRAVVTECVKTPVGRTESYKPIALEQAMLGETVEAVVQDASFACLKGKVLI